MGNEKELELFFELSLDLLCIAGLDGYFKRLNPAFEKTLGYYPEELLAKPFLTFIHPEDKKSTLVEMEKLAIGNPSIHFENRYLCKNGEYKWLSWTAFPFLEEHLIYAVARDITEKKQLESQLFQAQRLESIGTLAGGISHDLNNILTPILSIAQLLPLRLINIDEHTQKILKILETNAKRGADLVQQILSFARGIEGKTTIILIHYLVQEIEQIIKGTFPKSIETIVDISPELWPVLADATQLHQVLMNLCINARDAMLEGGTLTISADNILIDENYAHMNLDAHVGSYVVVKVKDTGKGISPKQLDKIFDPFFTTKDRGKGTGLGLSTVMGIIKSHGGFINVDTKLGQGSTFTFYLPAVINYEAEPIEDKQLYQGQGELILVIDDELAICEVIKTSLEAHNYQVITAGDGVEALALYVEQQQDIQVVLVDMMMPVMDGTLTIRTLKKINPKIKIIPMTGLKTKELVNSITKDNVQTILSKPFTTEDLLYTLHQALGFNDINHQNRE